MPADRLPREPLGSLAAGAGQCPALRPVAMCDADGIRLAEIARTVVASGHRADLLLPGHRAGSLSYLDDGGEPLLLLPPGRDLPQGGWAGTVGLRIGAGAPALGEVVLLGRLRPLTRAEDRGEVLRILRPHAGCAGLQLPYGCARPIRLEVETVLVAPSPHDESPPHVLLENGYADAVPRLFEALGPVLGEHLTAQHQDRLVALAVSRGLVAASEVIAVTVVRVDAAGLDVRVVDASGSRPVRLAFPQPLSHPHQFGTALRAISV